jgi:hypothetical protein
MKVIKKQDVSNWNLTYHCNNCDSDLEIYAGDIKYWSYDGDFRDPSYEYFSCNCAVCNDQHTIPSSNIPKLIQLEVKSHYGK